MNRGVCSGNGNRAVWRNTAIYDGWVYRMPNGELVRASVEPHPVSLPEYWRELPDGHDAYSVAKGLTLSAVWPEDGSVAPGTCGTARLELRPAGKEAGVPWATGYHVYDLDLWPRVLREEVGAAIGIPTGWTIDRLVVASEAEREEFVALVERAERARKRLVVVKELMEPEARR